MSLELQMKDQTEERSLQLLRNLNGCGFECYKTKTK